MDGLVGASQLASEGWPAGRRVYVAMGESSAGSAASVEAPLHCFTAHGAPPAHGVACRNAEDINDDGLAPSPQMSLSAELAAAKREGRLQSPPVKSYYTRTSRDSPDGPATLWLAADESSAGTGDRHGFPVTLAERDPESGQSKFAANTDS